MEPEELDRLFRIRKTILEMMDARGYIVGSEEEKMKIEDFKDKFSNSSRDNMRIFGYKKEEGNQTSIFVFWCDDKKLTTSTLKVYEDRLTQSNASRAIIIVQEKVTNLARQAIEEMSKIRIEIFLESELLVNITKHRYVPTHQILTDKEKHALLEKYHLKQTQLPRMQKSDPISRFYGLSIGQVVKIIRPSETAGRYVTYRIVL